MKTKTMKKFAALVAMISMIWGAIAPVLATSVPTSLTPVIGSGNNGKPIIKAKWEMITGSMGADHDIAAGAQFDAPGVWGDTLKYTVCAIVTDPEGLSDIKHVYADIFYPTGKALHDPNDDLNGQNHPMDPHKDTTDGANDTGIVGTPGRQNCDPFKEQNELIRMDTMAGYDLFCNKIFNNNNNLPVFSADAYKYNLHYDEICGSTGELMKQTAYVYCDDKTLKWEDPAGDYVVEVKAQDGAPQYSDVLRNTFEYLPLTNFEKDFSNIDYGSVPLSNPGDPHKKIMGDQNFEVAGNSLKPTIRNLGNTRLNVWIAQDDMGLGKTSGNWNVSYDARVGNNPNDWMVYDPFGFKPATPVWKTNYTELEDILDLSETEQMDFSILVTKFPILNTNYMGNMYLAAEEALFRSCEL